MNSLDELARAWTLAIGGTALVSMTRAELESQFVGLARQFTDALAADPVDSPAAFEVGAALIAAELTTPDALSRTIEILGAALGSVPDCEHQQPQSAKVIGLLGSLAAGYAKTLRDRTFDGQEGMRRAALAACAEAEHALRESEARYRHLSLHDPLTSLPNRALLDSRLQAVFAEPEPAARVGLCFLDLDRFKAVNDTFGHHVGDRLLIEVAGRLADSVGAAGHLLARWAGDEFVILVVDSTGIDEVTAVAEDVLAALERPVRLDGCELLVSASIGIVEQPVADTRPQELLRAADMTLYWAKTDGGGRWAVFDPQRDAGQVIRYELAAALPAALGRDEFAIVYQPIVDMAGGGVVGAEALVRWRHPRLGVLAPGQFVGLAEETALINPLGRLVLGRACQQARVWHDELVDAPFVSVNLAVQQARDPGLVDVVGLALGEAGLPPDRLQLEITESAVMQTDERSVAALRQLADLGVRLALDDFGTGYSNLAYLGRLPIGVLKLAGLFLERLDSPSPVEGRVLAGVIGLAHDIGLEVTAEGVETSAHARHLGALGCDTGQGWHYGRPSSGQAISARCHRLERR